MNETVTALNFAPPPAPARETGNDASHTPAQQAQQTPIDTSFAHSAPHKPTRTLGLKIFDAAFYGGVVNSAIFLASAASTYWTYHGNTVGKTGGALRWVGEQFYKRRKPIENTLEKIGVTGEAAKIGTTVFWSFFDGTVFTPLIKAIEDHRERIALSIDTLLGTKSTDMRAYEAEPKQGWKSVFLGRMETLSIVLPVAIIMEKTGGNKRIFYNGGEKMMRAIEERAPIIDQKLSGLVAAPHVQSSAAELATRKKTLFHVLSFEGFYTSICTVGTYLFSRVFARKHPKPEKHAPHQASTPADSYPSADTPEKAPSPAKDSATPSSTISHASLAERLAAPQLSPELSA